MPAYVRLTLPQLIEQVLGIPLRGDLQAWSELVPLLKAELTDDV